MKTIIFIILAIGIVGISYPMKGDALALSPSFHTVHHENSAIMKEIWKDIPGYEGCYQISDHGNVKSLQRKIIRSNSRLYSAKEHLLNPIISNSGYRIVSLRKNGNQKTYAVSALIAIAFLDHQPDRKIVVDHINNIKTDDRLENLQVITQRINSSKDRENPKSKYIGVCWNKNKKKWHSKIHINGKQKFLGYFDDEQEAAVAYRQALKEQDPPKKTKKEKKQQAPAVVIDTTTVSTSERAVVDSVAMEQRKVLKELNERIEKQKTQKK